MASVLILSWCRFSTNSPKEDSNNLILVIKESSRSWRTPDYKPEETTNEYDIILNKEYSINNNNLNFKITQINDKNIIIETSSPFSDYKQWINLMTDKTEFTIKLNRTTKLTTPTMDAWNIYYLTLKK